MGKLHRLPGYFLAPDNNFGARLLQFVQPRGAQIFGFG